jgi:predicted nucleotidyltransferase
MLGSLTDRFYDAVSPSTVDPIEDPKAVLDSDSYDTPDLEEYGFDADDIERYTDEIETDEALAVTGEGVTGEKRPTAINEAVAVRASLANYSDRLEDIEGLGEELYQAVIDDRGVGEALLEASDEDDQVHPAEVSDIYADVRSDSFTFVHDDGWEQAGETTGTGIEIVRKRRSAMGKKSPREYPDRMYRLREVELEDGEPVASWREAPTPTTTAVHEAAGKVMDRVRQEYPSAELTMFGSVEEGQMAPGSDIEHGLHLDVEDVDAMVAADIEDTHDVHEHYTDVHTATNELRKEIERQVIAAADEQGADVRRGYGYVSVRDDDLEYSLNREGPIRGEDRRVLVTDAIERIEYNDRKAELGVVEGHPSRME